MGNFKSKYNESNNIIIKDTVIDSNDTHHTISSFMKKINNKSNKDIVVRIMMPLYYTHDKLTKEDVERASLSWNNILNNQSFKFLNEIKSRKLNIKSCKEWFETVFYQRLFDVHPLSKYMFKNPETQGRFLSSLLSFIFTILEDEDKFNLRLVELALSHCKRGVKACEYAIIGDVMFWSLREVLGSLYDDRTNEAWIKIFSMMLKVIVPIAIDHELKDNKAQYNRMLNKTKGNSNTNLVGLIFPGKGNQVSPDNCPYGFKA
mmetsp:Transcript_22680/g.20597  ORF Transcript_22680/g.20597 Transcript_22680/m.20597 type:complete len:261 (+) Transcript_22680:32-814(+)